MAYGFSTEQRMGAFAGLDAIIREVPEPFEISADDLRRAFDRYLAAVEALLRLMRDIMAARLEQAGPGGRFGRFLLIYDGALADLMDALRREITALLETEEGQLALREYLLEIKLSRISLEMVAFVEAVNESSGEGEEAEADQEAGTAVTNSLKDLIQRHATWKPLKPILHALNEVLQVVKGAC